MDQREGAEGYSRNGEQVWLPQGWEGSNKRIGSGSCSGEACF